MLKYTRQENGYSLLLALMVVVLISVLGLSLLLVTANSIKISTNERDNQSVFYIAEGGLNKTKSSIEQLAKKTYTGTEKAFRDLPPKNQTQKRFEQDFIAAFDIDLIKIPPSVTFGEQFNEHPKADITITQVSTTPLQYKIRSDGKIGSKKRAVAQVITINLPLPGPIGPPFTSTSAIHAIQNIDLGGGTVNGDVVSDKGNINIDWGTNINGKFGTTTDKFSKPKEMTISNEFIGNVAFPENILPLFPDSQFTKTWQYTNSVEVTINEKQMPLSLQNNSITIDGDNKKGKKTINGNQGFSGTLPLTQDMYLKNFTVTSNVELTIDVGNSDKNLFIDHFNLSQGHLNIVGKGKLTIYMKDSFKIGGDSSMNSAGIINRLDMYYAGTPQLNFEGATNTKASMYVKSANMNINASGRIEGNIYSGGSKITVAGGSYNHNLYLYAPSAEVTLGGSGSVTGGIMANTVKTSGNPTVTYQTNPNQGTGGADEDKESEEIYNLVDSSGSMLEEE